MNSKSEHKSLVLSLFTNFIVFSHLFSCAHEQYAKEPVIPKMYDFNKRSIAEFKIENLSRPQQTDDGIVFECPTNTNKTLSKEILNYFKENKIHQKLFHTTTTKSSIKNHTKISFKLKKKYSQISTIAFKDIPDFDLADEEIILPALNNQTQIIKTVSKKEILLAMMQRGRKTLFDAEKCQLSSLKDFVGIRQNTSAWGQKLDWYFPDDKAKWNTQYWDYGTPIKGTKLADGLRDMFLNPRLYAIGCYTAAKLVMIQGVYDYYYRVEPNQNKLQIIEEKLWSDNDPLVNLEPGHAWDFYPKMTPEEKATPGKILDVQKNIPFNHIIPGDWIYMFNAPGIMTANRGYEGSNAIYLGRNQFTDYYNIHGHSYTFEELIDKVYQWRNNVYDRPDDNKNIKPLYKDDLFRLAKTPDENGIFIDYRIYPVHF